VRVFATDTRCFYPCYQILMENKSKIVISKYSIQAHLLNIETGRYNVVPGEQRICTLYNRSEI